MAIYGSPHRIEVFDMQGNFLPSFEVLLPHNSNYSKRPTGLQLLDGTYYVFQPLSITWDGITYPADTLLPYSAVQSLNYHGFVGYQLDTHDFDTIYVLTTNTVHGDLVTDRTFNEVRVFEYVISTDTWTNILNPTTGQPQLAMPYDLDGTNRIIADNRKNFRGY